MPSFPLLRPRAHRRRMAFPAALILACSLSACGGGGGGGGLFAGLPSGSTPATPGTPGTGTGETPGATTPDTPTKPELRCAP